MNGPISKGIASDPTVYSDLEPEAKLMFSFVSGSSFFFFYDFSSTLPTNILLLLETSVVFFVR